MLGQQFDPHDWRGESQAFEAFAQHAADALRIARGRRQLKPQDGRRCPYVRQTEFADRHPAHALRQPAAQTKDKATGHEKQPRRILDGGRQFDRLPEMFREAETHARIRPLAEGARQHVGKAGPQPLRQTGPRQTQQIADPAYAETGKASHPCIRQFQRVERQGPERGRKTGQGQAARAGGIVRHACEPARGKRCRGNRDTNGVAQSGCGGNDAIEQGIEPAEETQRAAHFEQQHRRRIETDFGSETAGPAGQRFEQRRLAPGVALAHGKRRQERPCIGQSHAGNDAALQGDGVAGNDAFVGDDRARRCLRTGFERQQRKAECKPQHRRNGKEEVPDAAVRVRAAWPARRRAA